MTALPKWLWTFLDGWKTWIWAVAMALKTWHPEWGIWGTVDALAAYVGWDSIAPAIDPGQLFQWATFAVATVHKFLKALAEYRAGVPLTNLLSQKKR